jgi:hypothetical protein
VKQVVPRSLFLLLWTENEEVPVQEENIGEAREEVGR